MDHYTVMLVVDATAPVRRFQIAKAKVRKMLIAAAIVIAIGALGMWDYTRLRADNSELDDLRVEVAEQREQIQGFERALLTADRQLDEVRELERKVRIIANLPGAAGVGGEEVTELAPPSGGEFGEETAEVMPPAGVPVHTGPFSQTFPPTGVAAEGPEPPPVLLEREGLTSLGARHLSYLSDAAGLVSNRADEQSDSLVLLVDELEEKRNRLASMPSVWPTRGWLTSRFGPRVSPFTGRRQKHSGIDIAGRAGTAINSPARGRVASIGSRGPLGNSVVIDHGFGVKTFYGHTQEIFVKVGDSVERGQKLAAIGSSGRSTGPHLHYAIHVNGKARDPLNYIFD
jgi:murein DD-endopeptidase MepM/ murein hydrolase activator NlpD